jgi:hypothetical protein
VTKALQVRPDELSRRTILLRGVACAAGAATLLSQVKDAKAAKMAPAAAGYQDSPKGAQQCDGCALFQAPNACQLVDGSISPSGWCKFFAKKAS